MLRIIVGMSVIGLVSLFVEPVCAQGNGQRGGQGGPRQMQANGQNNAAFANQANGQNNAAMANQANGQNNQMGDQDMSNLAQTLMTNYDADSSGSLDVSELSQALLGLRGLMMRNQRNMQNANAANNANAKNANANGAMMNQGGRVMGMGPGGGGGRGMRPKGNGGN